MTQENMEKPELQLAGEDGNAFAIIGRAHKAAREAGWDEEHWTRVFNEATEGDYDNLLRVFMKYFDTW